MTVSAWRIAATTPRHTADDLSGGGAELEGGRWNSVGMPAVYASENISLALLETIAHVHGRDVPINRYLVRINVPNDIWRKRIALMSPPEGWSEVPPGYSSARTGDDWLKARSSALLIVPSVIVPEECTIILNPRHSDAQRISATTLRKWNYDTRYF